MKKAASILVGIASVLSIVAILPVASYAAGSIVSLTPSESQAVETGGPKFIATPATHYMDVSESQKVDTGSDKLAVLSQAGNYGKKSNCGRLKVG